jgi:hypothetical protein
MDVRPPGAAPRWKTRVFGHALQCGELDKIDLTLRDRVCTGADILQDLNPLAIARIKIGGQTPAPNSQDTELPDSVRRMGKFLLSMLRIEYEKRKVPIANLSISEANTRLKDLIKKYIKKVYPFDRKLRTDETAYEWWSYLDKDRSGDAQPLAVCQTRS